MNSSSAVLQRVGAQRPTHLLTPDGDFDFSDGDIAVELCANLGLELLDWQRWLVRWILATDDQGRPACNTVIALLPRQNGKGAVLEAIELFWLLVADVPIVIHTAHETDTAAGHMDRIEALTDEPAIPIPNVKTNRANGKERTRNLDQNLVLQYRTRTKSSKRGASPQRIVLDECQELQDAHISALIPGLAAQSMNDTNRPQMIYTGSAPLEHSLYMHGLLRQVQERKPERTLLAMWAADPGDDPEDVDLWYRTNPSLGLLISEEWVRDAELVVMSPADFLAERCGAPKSPAAGGLGPISGDRWAELADAESMSTDDTVSLGLDAPIGRESAVFAVDGRRVDGLRHASIRHAVSAADIGDVVSVAARLAEGHGTSINIPPKSPALAWLDDLESAGVAVNVVSAGDFQQAQQSIEQDVADGTLRHRGQIDMAHAVAGLAARVAGDVSPWSRRSSSADVSSLMALAAARAGGRVAAAEFFAY